MADNRFILDRPTGRTLRARDALVCVFVTVAVLLIVQGNSIRSSGEKMEPGVQRDIVLFFGGPGGWVADRFGVDDDVKRLTASLSPDETLSSAGGFDDTTAPGVAQPANGGIAPVTPDAFDPAALGEKPAVLPKLAKLLVTGDSLSQPLDVQLARQLASDGVKVIREPHLGTGISKSDLLDWGRLSTQQVKKEEPEAIVFFLGANEGFPFEAGGKSVACCGPAWAAQYATRARQMMQTYRRDGDARLYWLLLPGQRSGPRQKIARVVNAAIVAAAAPYRAHVRVLDMSATFTPGGRYRASMPVDGRNTIVRDPDGIHLNEAGAALAAEIVLDRLKADFASLK
jgi:lysophospholipase L1-like esterase